MSEEANVLVVGAEEVLGAGLHKALADAGYQATHSRTQEEVLREVSRTPFDVAFVDLRDSGPEDLALLGEIRGRQPRIEVIVTSRHPSIEGAKIAVRLGACEFLSQPVSLAELLHLVAEAIRRKAWSMRLCSPEGPGAGAGAPAFNECWVTYEGDGLATLGLDPDFTASLGRPVYVELPLERAIIARGRALLRVLLDGGAIRPVASPLSGQVRRVNEALACDVAALRLQDQWAVQMALAPLSTGEPNGAAGVPRKE